MLNVKVRQKPQNLAKLISEAPRNARGDMTEEAAKYLIGNERRGLSHYPKYKHITRKRAYGVTFFSNRQRRFVMAKIRSGEITPGKANRTYKLRRGWQIKYSGAKATVYNTEEFSKYVMGNDKQANLNKLVGWRTTDQVIKDNEKGMTQAANQALARYLKQKGL